MNRVALALATLALLLLNGSMALAATTLPSCSSRTEVCVMPLAMLTPPPARPAHILLLASLAKAVIPVHGAR